MFATSPKMAIPQDAVLKVWGHFRSILTANSEWFCMSPPTLPCLCMLAKACLARQVVTLLRWRIVELYYREVDELLYELSNLSPTETFVSHWLPDCWLPLPAVLHCFGNNWFECRLGVVSPVDTCIAIVPSYHTLILQDGSIMYLLTI